MQSVTLLSSEQRLVSAFSLDLMVSFDKGLLLQESILDNWTREGLCKGMAVGFQ